MWETLYEKHYKELVRYCYGICQDVELAQDMAQETFLKALQNCYVLEDLGPQQRRAWLYKAARNLLYDKLRRAALESRTLPALEAPEEQEEGGFGQVEVEQILACLTPEEQSLFYLRYVEGYNATELAELYAQPPSTIRARLLRIRKRLSSQLIE